LTKNSIPRKKPNQQQQQPQNVHSHSIVFGLACILSALELSFTMSTVDTDTAIFAIDKIKEATLAGMKSDEKTSIDQALGGDKDLAGVFDDLRDLVKGINMNEGIFALKSNMECLYDAIWKTIKELGHLLDWDNTWMHVDYLADLLDFVRAFGKSLGKEERHDNDIFYEGWEPAVEEESGKSTDVEGDKVLANYDDFIVRAYTMVRGGPNWWNYIVMFESSGEQEKVFIENNKGTFLQDEMKLFYQEDHKDQFRLEELSFEEDKWAEVIYED
jgi:hypothetical protein